MPRIVAYLQRTAQKCRENAGHVGGMSNNPAARMAAMQLDEAARRCDEAAQYLSHAPPKARAWAEHMVSGVRTAGPGDSPGPNRSEGAAGRTPPTEGQREKGGSEPGAKKIPGVADAGDEPSAEDGPPPKISHGEALGLLRKLPVRLGKIGHREKTRGIWKGDDGNEHDLISGQGDYYRQAQEFAIKHRLGEPPGSLSITSHVEIKFAMLMRERGLMNETIVINKETCKGDASCDKWLPYFLPPGAKLTVYGPSNFKETYPKEPPSGGTIPT
jgi:hypothetical protein